MSGGRPKVSVLVLAYNHERYIAQALESALMQQTDFPFEIVVGEDCSTDGTRAIVEAYQQQYPEVIKLLPARANLGATRNYVRTLSACAGDYIAILEGDDYWTSPHKLQAQADVLDSRPEIALCFAQTAIVDPDGALQYFVNSDDQAVHTTIDDLLTTRWHIATASTMFRKRPRLLSGEILPFFSADVFTWVMVAHTGDLYYLPEQLAAYRKHAGGISVSNALTAQIADNLRMFKFLDAALGYRYHRAFQRAIAMREIDLLAVDLANGTRPWVPLLALKGLARTLAHGHLPTWREVSVTLQQCAPALYRAARRVRRAVAPHPGPETLPLAAKAL